MNKFFATVFLTALFFAAAAQNTSTIKPYGKVDRAELDLKQCDFEPDANAEVLFDGGYVYFDENQLSPKLVFDRHTRIKIFNDNGKDYANVRIEYFSGGYIQNVSRIDAETINEENGKIVISKVDKSQIFDKPIDHLFSSVTFTFPNVKPGSILEYHYIIVSKTPSAYPTWYFQSNMPTKYSEISATIPDVVHYKNYAHIIPPYVKLERDANQQVTLLAMANLSSVQAEPFMTTERDNMQVLNTELFNIHGGSLNVAFDENWDRIAKDALKADNFGDDMTRSLAGESEIIKYAKGLKSDDEKLAYIFDLVKSTVKWNDYYGIGTFDGTSKAWDKKIGDASEINLILLHLLTKVGLKVFPMLLSTKEHGKVNPAIVSRNQFNTVAVYLPIDSTNYYVMDATGKNNTYKVTPDYLLNSFGLAIDGDTKTGKLLFIENSTPSRNIVLLNADVTADGKLRGSADISSDSYNRMRNIDVYKKDGEQKYTEKLKEGNNSVKIASLKLENMETDSLPLLEHVGFTADLPGADGTYIYFKPNLFTSLGPNPFLSEKRMTDIDFKHLNVYSITGNYKLPVGYKPDALPKSTRMDMSDQSISFRRQVLQDEGVVTVKYIVIFHKSMFLKENYAELHEFYKKMYEMMDEQVILKKS